MNADQIAALRVLLAPTDWLDRTRAFARALRRELPQPQGLLVLGTPADEPWHMTAHFADESRLAGHSRARADADPLGAARGRAAASAARHRPAAAAATRTETLLVVSGQHAPAELLERLNDVRKIGTTIFALDQGDTELDGLANEALAVPPQTSPMSFDAAQHLVTAAVGEPGAGRPGHGSYPLEELDDDDGDYGPRHASHRADRWEGPAAHSAGRAGRLRSRLARILDTVSGSGPDSA